MFLFSSNTYPEMELMHHMVILFLIFWGNFILISILTSLIYIHSNSAQVFPFHSLFSTSSPAFAILCYFDTSHSDRCEGLSHCGFDLHFPDSYVEYLFMCLLAICMTSLGKRLFQRRKNEWSFAHFLIPLLIFFLCWAVLLLCIFLLLTSIRYIIWKYFIPFNRLLFHLADNFLHCAKAF